MNQQERIASLVRRSLQRGQTVELDGLGVFRAAEEGGYEIVRQAKPQVFVAYVSEDLAQARRLRDGIAAAGYSPWLDRDKLLPGQNWPRAIERAIEISDAFIACFSGRSIAKRGQFQSELRYALDCARRLPLDTDFVVPVRFEPCAVPRRIADHVQYVDLFPEWDRGMKRVVRALGRALRAPVS
jgi:TIR domain